MDEIEIINPCSEIPMRHSHMYVYLDDVLKMIVRVYDYELDDLLQTWNIIRVVSILKLHLKTELELAEIMLRCG